MGGNSAPRRIRADAERSTTRILAAAETVLAVDGAASLERIADAGGARPRHRPPPVRLAHRAAGRPGRAAQ